MPPILIHCPFCHTELKVGECRNQECKYHFWVNATDWLSIWFDCALGTVNIRHLWDEIHIYFPSHLDLNTIILEDCDNNYFDWNDGDQIVKKLQLLVSFA